MLLRTHLVIGVAVALYFLPFVTNKFIFFPIVLLASLLPNISTGFSGAGKSKFFRSMQGIANNRGILHTYTFCIFLSVLLVIFFPRAALPFFVGYSFHLLADSFTKQGIMPFWPLKNISSGVVRTGGTTDKAIFITFIVIDAVLLITTFARMF